MAATERTFWTFVPNADSCSLCQDMAGTYHGEPLRPHEQCTCTIFSGSVPVEEQDRHSEVIDRYQLLEQVQVTLPPGGTGTAQKTWSTGTTTTGTGNVKIGPITVGGSQGTTTTTGAGESETFKYDDHIGGRYQLVFAEYRVTVYKETINWLVKWSEVVDDVPDEPFSTVDRYEEREFVGYYQEAF